MTDTTASEYGLRARVKDDNRPIGQLTDKQRGMRAAFEVLKGTLSPRSAKIKYLVKKDSLRYYTARLVKDGVAETIASVARVDSAPGSAPSTAEDEKENAGKTKEWDAYCNAYVLAGQLINKGMSKRAGQRRSKRRISSR